MGFFSRRVVKLEIGKLYKFTSLYGIRENMLAPAAKILGINPATLDLDNIDRIISNTYFGQAIDTSFPCILLDYKRIKAEEKLQEFCPVTVKILNKSGIFYANLRADNWPEQINI